MSDYYLGGKKWDFGLLLFQRELQESQAGY